MKKPIGRSAPFNASYCDNDCEGYRKPPYPGSLWPGETEEDFGYKISDDGTKRVVVEADKTEVGVKTPTEVDHLKANQKQQEIMLKSRQAQELLQAKQRELSKKTRDDMNKIKTGEKPTSSATK
jgi:hypothetical protein